MAVISCGRMVSPGFAAPTKWQCEIPGIWVLLRLILVFGTDFESPTRSETNLHQIRARQELGQGQD